MSAEQNQPDHRPQPLPPSLAVLQLGQGHQTTQLVYVAAKLGIVDALAGGPKLSSEVAQELQLHPQALQRVMRGLANIAVLAEDNDGRFSLTPLGDILRIDVPGSRHGWAIYAGEMMYHAWGDLLHTLRTGETAFDHHFGQSLFPYLEQDPEMNVYFNQAMVSNTVNTARSVVAAYDFSSINTIVDVGGGYGTLIAEILQAHPQMAGILFDTAHVIAGARSTLAAAGVADRCKTVTGDMFQDIPNGADAYILSRVIHDWDDEQAIRILSRCRAAMPQQAKLLLVEQVLPDHVQEASRAVLIDLVMLVMTGGQERTTDQYRSLLSASGFTLNRIIPTSSDFEVIEARPTV